MVEKRCLLDRLTLWEQVNLYGVCLMLLTTLSDLVQGIDGQLFTFFTLPRPDWDWRRLGILRLSLASRMILS